MKRIIGLLTGFIMLTGAAFIFAQEDGGEDEEQVSAAEIVTILEEINQKLERFDGKKWDGEDKRAPDEGFGGGSYWPVRIFFGMDTMNTYVQGLGSYAPFPKVSIPFRDGGGGTWRISFNKYFQIGWNYWGGGYSSLGQQNHQDPATSPNAANITVDEDGDGLDDYYSYASYDYFYWSFLAMGKIPVHKLINIVAGAQAGIGGEAFDIYRNERSVVESALTILNGDSNWSRMLFVPGGWVGVQFNMDKKNIFKLGLDVGFEYPIPLETWQPGPGTHTEEPVPPEDFSAFNLNVGLNMQFHF